MAMQKRNEYKYTELARASLTKTRSIVISSCSKAEKVDGYTVAQQVESVDEDTGEKVSVYLKGAFHIADVAGLYEMRDALNAAIKAAEEAAEWDEAEEQPAGDVTKE